MAEVGFFRQAWSSRPFHFFGRTPLINHGAILAVPGARQQVNHDATQPHHHWFVNDRSPPFIPAAASSAAEAVARVGQSARRTVENGTIQAFQSETVAWTAGFEARYSRFVPDSLVSRLNAAAGKAWLAADAEAERIFDQCGEFFRLTGGAFDPTALPLTRLWNWKASPPAMPTAGAIAAARELVGWDKIQRRPGEIFLPRAGMSLDLGGIGKEFAVDTVVALARKHGLAQVLVDFGQDVRAVGHAPDKPHWLIGLEDARQPGHCWTGVAVTNQAVASSGDYQRHFIFNGQRYGHILDPRTGWPASNEVRAASIIAPSCTLAGLLATSACVLGVAEAIRLIEKTPDTAGAITTADQRIYSDRFESFIPG